jgi:hypothetical protein
MESLHAIPPELLEGSYLISYNGGCLNRIGDDRTPLLPHASPPEGRSALCVRHQARLREHARL